MSLVMSSQSDFLQHLVTSNQRLIHVCCIRAELNRIFSSNFHCYNRISKSPLCCQILGLNRYEEVDLFCILGWL